MFGDESDKTSAQQKTGSDSQIDPAPPMVKAPGKGAANFVESGTANTAQDAKQAKAAYDHEIKLKELDRDAAKERDEYELRRAKQQADIAEQQRENNSRRRYRLLQFIGVLILVIVDVTLNLRSDVPLEKLGPVDGIIRFAMGWLMGLVASNGNKPSETQPSPLGA